MGYFQSCIIGSGLAGKLASNLQSVNGDYKAVVSKAQVFISFTTPAIRERYLYRTGHNLKLCSIPIPNKFISYKFS